MSFFWRSWMASLSWFIMDVDMFCTECRVDLSLKSFCGFFSHAVVCVFNVCVFLRLKQRDSKMPALSSPHLHFNPQIFQNKQRLRTNQSAYLTASKILCWVKEVCLLLPPVAQQLEWQLTYVWKSHGSKHFQQFSITHHSQNGTHSHPQTCEPFCL